MLINFSPPAAAHNTNIFANKSPVFVTDVLGDLYSGLCHLLLLQKRGISPINSCVYCYTPQRFLTTYSLYAFTVSFCTRKTAAQLNCYMFAGKPVDPVAHQSLLCPC